MPRRLGRLGSAPGVSAPNETGCETAIGSIDARLTVREQGIVVEDSIDPPQEDMMDDMTDQPLGDDDMTTTPEASSGPGVGGDADGTDGDATDTTDGDTTDSDGSDSDGSDSDGSDSDGSDSDGSDSDGSDSDGTDGDASDSTDGDATDGD